MNVFDKYFFNKLINFQHEEAPVSLNYFHPDSKSRFLINLQKFPNSIHLLNYKKNPIEYKLNNYGFRTPDNFTSNGEGNIFLGCSHTFGIGHYLENTWSYKLSKKVGGKFYNISEPGCGVMTQYRYLKGFANKLKFKNVFHFLPDECFGRYEYPFNDEYFESFYMDPQAGHLEKYKNWFSDVLTVSQFRMSNNMVYIDAIKSICNDNDADYYLITKSFLNKNIDVYDPNRIPARDVEHYYVDEQESIYNEFLNQYNEKNRIKSTI
jgi:hypothetical protein